MTIRNLFHQSRCSSAVLACLFLCAVLTGCTVNDDDPEAMDPADQAAPAEPASAAAPSFSDEEIAAMRQFSDEELVALMQNNLACELLDNESVAEVFGEEWAPGRFNWFESELRRATSALRGICLFVNTERMTTVTLRVYASSDLAWELNRRDDDEFARRFSQRPLEPANEIAPRAYRKPMGAENFDLTCADLGDYIACLSASARHTDDWEEKDRAIMAIIAENIDRMG
jgi:hypothetical protein